ncbi:MAG TPA: prepilin-type N-terminal cleavage/methylation domain-containing protein [Candidatus Aquilonibacter sp.]|nr:prepilin-type N-terminal cleavage/methylation domain-containing protein [Candidatus Aquilonibacter sp.]
MKLPAPTSVSNRAGSPTSTSGFTLPEILIALTIFMLMLAGIITANLFGLQMFQLNENKLNATEWSRNTFGKITDEIRACSAVSVGNMTTNGVFVGLLDGEAQEGTAIEIQPNTNSTSLIYYFLDSSDETFRRTELLPSGSNTIILADSVTNTTVFTAQDFSGNVLTNDLNDQVIHLTLEFYQPERYLVDPDYYKLETSVTRRAAQ